MSSLFSYFLVNAATVIVAVSCSDEQLCNSNSTLIERPSPWSFNVETVVTLVLGSIGTILAALNVVVAWRQLVAITRIAAVGGLDGI
ncbi:hypothetical protein BDY21DRAFT_338125 [Lineolata rhizophorae]|uniref:Uncharacterized protein n=1 Tax=Lineolata rhizophorae TaxID=578093 RepID=A0A6A6P5W7_9PEZI|nr:hypothetical protein BDY21DRAFT_338125 [Lineolata rhizophorae]